MARARCTTNDHVPSVPRPARAKKRVRYAAKGSDVAERGPTEGVKASAKCGDAIKVPDLSSSHTTTVVVDKKLRKAIKDLEHGRSQSKAPNAIQTGQICEHVTNCKSTPHLGDERKSDPEMPSVTAHPGSSPTKREAFASNGRRATGAVLLDVGKGESVQAREDKNMMSKKRKAGRATDEETIDLGTSEGVARSELEETGRNKGSEAPRNESRGTDVEPTSVEESRESVSIPTNVRRSARLALKSLEKSSRPSDLVHTKGSGTGRVRKRTTRRRYAGRRQTAAGRKRTETDAPIDLDLVDFIKLRDVNTPAVSEDRYTLTSQWKAGKCSSETFKTMVYPI